MKTKIQIVLLLIATPFFAQTPDKAKLDDYFKALESNNKFMGTVAISKNGKTVYSKSIGYADTGKKLPLSGKSKFRVGSISKMFTAAMVFKAVEENKLKLSDNLSNFYPAVPNAAKISVGQMLAHRSGIHNFTDNQDYLSWAYAPKTQAEMLAIISKDNSEFEPDSKADYSNSNYVLLTYILEKVYKKPYSDLLRDKITKPLSLKNTYMGGKINTAAAEANSYEYKGEWEKNPETDASVSLGAGGVVSNPEDLSRFIEALFAGKVISKQSLEQMKTMKDKYGMGMFEFPFGDKIALGHTGGIDAFTSMLGYFPEDNVTFAMTSNGTNFNNNDIAIAVLSWFYNKPFDVPVFKTFALKTGELDQYLGVYATKELPMKITVTKNNLTLVAQATGQSSFPMDATEKDVFEYKAAGVVLEFKPELKQMILKQNGRMFTFVKE